VAVVQKTGLTALKDHKKRIYWNNRDLCRAFSEADVIHYLLAANPDILQSLLAKGTSIGLRERKWLGLV
jgi:hypothetical protein